MSRKTAKADLTPVRQRTQYTCMSTSMMMCLRALGHDCNEDEVNKVMGARPMKGAAWEQALACAQHYGVRATLTTPSTVRQLKQWTDAGKPVMIAWNPEGREWSHASVVFDVDDDLNVYVADPNIPDPDETVRVVSKGDFYKKWYEKWPNYLVRRPALMLDREITVDGRQVMASQKNVASSKARVAEEYDRLRDRRLERGDHFRRAPKPLPPRSSPNPSKKVVKQKDVVIEAAGLKVTLQGHEHANGLISVEIKYPLRPYGHDYSGNPVQKAVKQMSRSDSSWVGQGTIIARRRYWLKGTPDQYGGWPEVRDLSQALRETGKPLSRIKAASPRRVASVFARKAAEARIDNSLKRKINARMRRLGLDGNGRFRKPDRGFAAAVDAMQEHGVTLDSVVSAFEFSARPSGTVRTDIAFIDDSQPFAPGITISNSILYLQYTEVSDDRFEVVAYLS